MPQQQAWQQQVARPAASQSRFPDRLRGGIFSC